MVVSSKRLDCPTRKSLFGLYIRVVVANVEKEVRVVGIASFCRCTVDLRFCFVLSYISGFLMPLPKMLGFFFITMLSFICPYESVNYHYEACYVFVCIVFNIYNERESVCVFEKCLCTHECQM